MNPMLPLVAVLALSALPFAFIPGTITWLEEATAEQCRTNDWPADKAVATRAWCVHNKYPVE
tara:strand:- start:154 stop:339 length:186 start_codon:yes stop_codon:yes gene_type:complete